MRRGTDADFFPDGKGGFQYIHADSCEPAPAATRKRCEIETRECSRRACTGAVGFAFPVGAAPPNCPVCHSPWEVDELEAAPC